MSPKKINTFSRYYELVERYGQKGCASNDYIQREAADLIVHDRLYEYCGEKNMFILVKKDGFWRVYFYLNDPSEKLILDGEELVTEILFRGNVGEPVEQVKYLENCGFKRNLVRDQYFAKYSSLSLPTLIHGLTITMAKTIEDVEWAIQLFNASFDKWSGDYLPLEMASLLIQEKAVLMAKDMNGQNIGALQFNNTMGVTWLNHIAVAKDARGKGVGQSLIDAYIEKGHIDDNSRYMLWVQRQNATATKLYLKKGFTYMNKSTLSLIKQ